MLVRSILMVCAFAAAAHAGEIAVTSDADAGPGTLRAALAAAASGDRIVLSLPGEDRAIALAADLPPAAGGVTLDFGDAPGRVAITGGAWTLARAGLSVTLGPRRHAVLAIVMAGEIGRASCRERVFVGV
jgi:hypothetical protein